VNVLLLPATPAASEVTARLGEWAATGLLDSFCVWSADDAGTTWVSRVSGGQSERLLLADALASAEPDAVEFVAFYPVAGDESPDPCFTEEAERFLGLAERVLDFDPDRPLVCAFAVSAATPDQPLPAALFRAEWSNLVVAPEDRAAPGGFNRLGKDHERFLRHASHALATIADLWLAPPARRSALPTRLREEPAGPQCVRVRVVRCFSRIVELGHIADHVAAFSFQRHDGWPRPGPDFERSADPEPLVAAVAGAYLKAHRPTLHRRPFAPITEDPLPPPGPVEALRTLFRQALAYLRKLPSELIEKAIEDVHDKVAVYIERLSGHEITVRRWRELEGDRGLADLSETVAGGPLVIEDGNLMSTWVELRETTLGLLDGSELPADTRALALAPQGRRVIVSDPGLLARDPEGGEDAEDSIVPLLERIRAEVSASLDGARERAAALAGDPDTEEEEDEEPEPGLWDLLRGGGRILGTGRRIVSLLLLALLGAAFGWVLLTPPAAAGATIALGAGWLYLAGRLARGVLALPRIPEDDRTMRELSELNRALERAQAEGDAIRLQRRFSELDEWIAILAELLHRPWVSEPFAGLEVVAPTDETTLPHACAVAVVDGNRELVERVGRQVQSETFGPGWLSSIYRHVEDLAMESLYLGSGGVGVPPLPFEGWSEDAESPLRVLRLVVQRGDGRGQWQNPMASELLKVIDRARLDELAPDVVRASTERRPLGPTATWIAPPDGVATVTQAHNGRVLGLRGWRHTAVVVAPGLALTSRSASEHLLLAGVGPEGSLVDVLGVELPTEADLTLLRLGEDDAPSPGEVEVAPLRAGDGVVALEGGPKGPTSRWGYVISDGEGARAIFDGGDPVDGSPVFDLQGRLLAIQGERGALVATPSIAVLLEMESEDVRPPASPNGAASAPSEPQPASAFLAKVANDNRYTELLPAYWAGPTDANAIEFSLPPGAGQLSDEETIGSLTEGAAYLRPLRVVVNRIEATHPVEPSDLSAVREAGPAVKYG
jgi:hypothetical protein